MIKILSTRPRDKDRVHAEVEWTEEIGAEPFHVYPWAVGNIPANVDPETWCNLPENYERIANDITRKFVLNNGVWNYSTPVDKNVQIADLAAQVQVISSRLEVLEIQNEKLA